MSQAFLNQFYPRIIHILRRERSFWEDHDYEVTIDPVNIFNTAFVLSGSGVITINGNFWSLKKGTWFHFCPGDQMKLTISRQDPLVYISTHFDYKLLHWEGAELHVKESRRQLPFPNVLFLGETSEWLQIYMDMESIWEEKKIGYEQEARSILTRMFNDIFKEQQINHPNGIHVMTMDQILSYLHDHYATPLNRDEMARKASLSSSYFSVLFKRHTGYSYIRYIQKLRIDKAKHLLREKNLSIAEVANQVGYEDPLYFSRTFSKETGMSPREYRKA